MGKITKIALFGSLGMVLGVSALQSLGSNLEQEFAAQAAIEPVAEIVGTVPQTEALPQIEEKAVASSRGATMLEQAILDAFPASRADSADERRRASNASDFLEASINAQGYLCADAVEMRQAAPGQYGIGCVMNRDGTGAAIYLVDSRTGSVTPIS